MRKIIGFALYVGLGIWVGTVCGFCSGGSSRRITLGVKVPLIILLSDA